MIYIKPLSVNKAWQGRRFKTKEYKTYEKELLLKLKPLKIPSGLLTINVTFYFKNKLSDIDNPLKPFLDILQKKYKFNDRDIYSLNVQKKISNKEGIKFEIIKNNL